MDLRRKVLDAYDRGDGSQSSLDRRGTTGSVAPRPSGAPSPKVTDSAREALRQIVAERPDGYARE